MSQRLTQLSEGGKLVTVVSCGWEKNTKQQDRIFFFFYKNRFTQKLSQWNPIIHFTLSSRSVSTGSKMLSPCVSMYCLPNIDVLLWSQLHSLCWKQSFYFLSHLAALMWPLAKETLFHQRISHTSWFPSWHYSSTGRLLMKISKHWLGCPSQFVGLVCFKSRKSAILQSSENAWCYPIGYLHAYEAYLKSP